MLIDTDIQFAFQRTAELSRLKNISTLRLCLGNRQRGQRRRSTLFMNQEYQDYLDSEAWKFRRLKRISIAGGRCEACGSARKLHVHHLTYERIFNEEMADLLVLCEEHHAQAERLIADGAISRKGNTTHIAVRTVLLIARSNPKDGKNNRKGERRRGDLVRMDMLKDPRFVDALRNSSRKEFKRTCRGIFSGMRNFQSLMTHALILFSRRKSKTHH